MTDESRFEARPEFPYRQDDAATGSAATPPPTVGHAATQTPATVRPGGRSACWEDELFHGAEVDLSDDSPYAPMGTPRPVEPAFPGPSWLGPVPGWRVAFDIRAQVRRLASDLTAANEHPGALLIVQQALADSLWEAHEEYGYIDYAEQAIRLSANAGDQCHRAIVALVERYPVPGAEAGPARPAPTGSLPEPSEQSVEGFTPSTSTKQVGAAEALSTTRPDPRAVEDEHGEDRVLTEPGAQPTPAGDVPRLCRYCGRLEAATPRPGSPLGPASEGACIPCWPYGGTDIYRFVECSFCGIEQPDDRRKCRHCFERLPLNQVLIECPKCLAQFSAGRFHRCPRVR